MRRRARDELRRLGKIDPAATYLVLLRAVLLLAAWKTRQIPVLCKIAAITGVMSVVAHAVSPPGGDFLLLGAEIAASYCIAVGVVFVLPKRQRE